jgi:hypothetical protein
MNMAKVSGFAMKPQKFTTCSLIGTYWENKDTHTIAFDGEKGRRLHTIAFDSEKGKRLEVQLTAKEVEQLLRNLASDQSFKRYMKDIVEGEVTT